MPPTLREVLTPLLVMILTSTATYFKIDAKDNAGNISALAIALAGMFIAAIGVRGQRKVRKKAERAEAIAPGITSVPTGSETIAKVSVNDPTTEDPPATIVHENKKTP